VVRWVVVFAVGIAACAGRSTKAPPAGEAGSSGTTGAAAGSGGSTGGEAAGTSSGTTASGGRATGGSGGEPEGGEGGSSAGTSGTSSSGAGGASAAGGSSAAGGTTAGTGGSGAGGTDAGGAGSAGEGGSIGECSEPNPAGCVYSGCPEDQACALLSGLCVHSKCECVGDGWICSEDCTGGACVDEVSCEGPNPAGCSDDEQCPDGERCLAPEDDACIPLGCACDLTGEWSCLEDCSGGECRAPSCPEGCQPSTEGFCDEDGGVTWVCGFDGPFDSAALEEGGCADLFTQVPRYCCPATFKPECQ
jgi:hypothetical protein